RARGRGGTCRWGWESLAGVRPPRSAMLIAHKRAGRRDGSRGAVWHGFARMNRGTMGERFGEYELIKKIATGGMAEIYLARIGGVEGFSRRVVVKRMLPQLAVRPDFVQMFLDEARLAANLVHPNIVQVFNLGQVDGTYFMAMELIDGPHL